MMMDKLNRYLFIVMLPVLLSACNPDYAIVEIYTSDVQLAKEGEVIEVPAQFKFETFGEGEQDSLKKATEIAKLYLPKDTEYSMSESSMGSVLVVDTTIPMGTSSAVGDYVRSTRSPLYVEVSGDVIYLRESFYLEEFSTAIEGIDFMMSLDMPASQTTIRVVSDSRDLQNVGAIAVFVSEQAHLLYEKQIKRRESVNMVFKGASDSVYSSVPVQFMLQPAN